MGEDLGTFAHRTLRVYDAALEMSDLALRVMHATPPRSRPVEHQLLRAVASIALNIAEGAAEFSPGDKARFYRIARRSAAETGAAFDLLARHRVVDAEVAHSANERLQSIAAMLTGMIQAARRRAMVATKSVPPEPARAPSPRNAVAPRNQPEQPARETPSPLRPVEPTPKPLYYFDFWVVTTP